MFIIAIKYDNEFITINYFDESLIKIARFVYNVDVKTIINQIDDVDLQKHWIIIWYDNFVKIAYIDDYTTLANRFFQNVYYSSNDKDWKIIENDFNDST